MTTEKERQEGELRAIVQEVINRFGDPDDGPVFVDHAIIVGRITHSSGARASVSVSTLDDDAWLAIGLLSAERERHLTKIRMAQMRMMDDDHD